MHGVGKWVSHTKKKKPRNFYKGDFDQGFKHGHGKFVWASGNIYNGEYRDDERDGFGEMKWTDGSIYAGTWKHGI